MNAGFCDCYRLLFHDFVNGDTINVGHFVKFVYADYPSISEDHGPCLQPALPGIFIGSDSRRETNARTASTGSGNCQWSRVQYEAQHL